MTCAKCKNYDGCKVTRNLHLLNFKNKNTIEILLLLMSELPEVCKNFEEEK